MDKQKAVRKSVGQESAFVDMLNQEMKELQEGLKQKQIEEMAKIILEASCKGSECANCEFVKRVEEAKTTCLCLKSLYNAGYRKIPENAVVLTEERNKIICDRFAQLERVQAELQELNAKYYNEAKDLRRELKRVRKETAEKFAERLKTECFYGGIDNKWVAVSFSRLNEIAKEFTEDKV